jgi:hypothetical protein
MSYPHLIMISLIHKIIPVLSSDPAVRSVKVKLSLYRPRRPLGLREVEAPTFSDLRLTNGGKVVSPTRRPLLPPGRFLVLISVRD